ncbi:MAG: GntR family transcriptional regulator [Planctomycetes bacterium]|nr:GntR family transcriptional regulator [Planctomycetota bacterium]
MSQENLSDAAYRHISDKLLKHELIPGQKISEPVLAKELGFSRTPVREAIQRLQNEGLLHQIPSSGTYVAQSDRVPLIETYEIRLALETMAVRKVAERIKTKDLCKLKKCCDEMKKIIVTAQKKKLDVIKGDLLTRFIIADMDFHLNIMKIAGNRTALKLITDAHMRNRIFGYLSRYRDVNHAKQTLARHLSILKAIGDHDSDKAYKLLYEHIELSMNEALEVLDEQYYS